MRTVWAWLTPEREAEIERNYRKIMEQKEAAAERQRCNRRSLNEYRKQWRARNKSRHSQYVRERKNRDPNFKLSATLRTRILKAIKAGRARKWSKSSELLGCNIEKARQWIEAKFAPGMAWENHGKWHIDHIIPCSSFDLTDAEQQMRCFHFTNLQPLWAEDNLRKGNRMDYQF